MLSATGGSEVDSFVLKDIFRANVSAAWGLSGSNVLILLIFSSIVATWENIIAFRKHTLKYSGVMVHHVGNLFTKSSGKKKLYYTCNFSISTLYFKKKLFL